MSDTNWAIELPKRIEHTQLAQEADESAIRRLCQEAQRFNFRGVCVNPVWVKSARSFQGDSDIQVISVAGFPLGASRTDIKVAEAAGAADDGASEIDMVANIGWLAGSRYDDVTAEIRKVRRNLPPEVTLKVILEVGKLTFEQMKMGVECAVEGGAQYVKTATGLFAPATSAQVRDLVQQANKRILVKAAGGIRTFQVARDMIEAGADRIGTSSSVRIMAELIGGGSG